MKKILFLSILFVSTAVFAQKVNYKKLDQYISQTQQNWNIPGLSVAIVKDGKIVFEKGYGKMDVNGNEKPDEHTLYAIASNTKAFTAAIMAQLVEEGKVNWKDKVQDHLPYFEVYDPAISRMVTVEDLLSHNVGLGTFSGDGIWYKSELSTEEVVKRIKFVPQAYDFRAGYGYSNLMFITAGALIEKVTDKSFKENVTERILKPLEMDDTVVSVKDFGSNKNVATPHAMDANNRNYTIPWVGWDNVQSTGGIISSVHDMSKWMILNMNHGVTKKNDTLFSEQNRNNMWNLHNSFGVNQVNRNSTGSQYAGYGLGWFLGDYQGNFRVRHGGGYDGMISTVQILPDENLGVVVLTNGVKAPTNAIAYYVFDRFLNRDKKDWSKEMLDGYDKWKAGDTRIADRKAKQVKGTQPTLKKAAIIGRYHADIYGNFEVKEMNGELKLLWEHTPLLNSTLSHFNYDAYEIHWDEPQAWFSFGTVKFESDAYGKVTGITFDVPNDDFFFNEMNATRVE
ncbi:CubicO group peptidase (beta-lactamase class C family) [Nonlabens xylanidelens]|uniref:CubicO group peptidase (Beta-lactamase class C family) n=1 Tax=Nonlabens xylanidelens TaxID=191564 RepID=A0A2S6INU7_9FLAO|nr:serine hydrolase [Nonlabens xylanidelens]PPK95851.1 CubicO group peptidase (beta-lactamase class C family) [Nonlabens xylanidelens]PQJ22634.1 serine hydrolase [Nonlabens xylanidelens]